MQVLSPAQKARKAETLKAWKLRNPDYMANWRRDNAAHRAEYTKVYRSANSTRVKAAMRKWHKDNRAHRNAYRKIWQKKNPKLFRDQKRRTEKRRLEKYPHIVLRKRMKALIGLYLKREGYSKQRRTTESITGCSAVFLKDWIESHFLPGMTWDNRSEWQVDHVFPVACCGSSESQILLAQSYHNLKPAWKSENRDKWCRLTSESLVSGFICGLSEIHLFRADQASDDLLRKAEGLGFKIFKKY